METTIRTLSSNIIFFQGILSEIQKYLHKAEKKAEKFSPSDDLEEFLQKLKYLNTSLADFIEKLNYFRKNYKINMLESGKNISDYLTEIKFTIDVLQTLTSPSLLLYALNVLNALDKKDFQFISLQALILQVEVFHQSWEKCVKV